jgi:hypothetical protein
MRSWPPIKMEGEGFEPSTSPTTRTFFETGSIVLICR